MWPLPQAEPLAEDKDFAGPSANITLQANTTKVITTKVFSFTVYFLLEVLCFTIVKVL